MKRDMRDLEEGSSWPPRKVRVLTMIGDKQTSKQGNDDDQQDSGHQNQVLEEYSAQCHLPLWKKWIQFDDTTNEASRNER